MPDSNRESEAKNLDNIIEQDHRFIKRRIRPMLGFKSFASAAFALEARIKNPLATGAGFIARPP
ncbi:DDE-type integrase/transposase/recombinase [Tropicibacter sp. R16_0]|nr:DDE-type integrase/transposase/recombinase [Tropicibacter sp. R16_0]